jgi:hypothetical protein
MAESVLEDLSDMTTIFQPQFIGNTAYRGITAPVLQSSEWEYDPASGYTFNQVYFGWDYAAMTQYANYFNAYGIGTRIKFENGKATLYTKDSTLATVIDKWEIQVDQTQPDIFQNEIFNFIMNTAADKSSAISLLRTALQNSSAANAAYSWQSLLDGLPAILDTAGNVTTTFMQALGVNFQYLPQLKNYFDDYNLGVTNFISGRYSLRHTTNAPNRWQANIADFNVERIYTISQLLSEVQNSGLWVLPLPGYLAYKIINYYVPNLIGPNYIWGALKMRSSANTIATSRVEIVTEYVIDQISTNLYYTI